MCKYNATISESTRVTDNDNTKVKHGFTDKMRIIVGVLIMPSNESHDVELFYQDKIKDYMLHLESTNLSLQAVFFSYERHRKPSLTFASPGLTIPHSGAILAPLHKDLLSKLKIMGTFPLIMRIVPT